MLHLSGILEMMKKGLTNRDAAIKIYLSSLEENLMKI